MADTIYALATARGRSAVAVVRLSGPRAIAAVDALTQRPLPPARRLSLRTLTDPATGAVLDEALVVRFEKGASFTGEPSAELHLHGGTALVAAVLHALSRLEGLRLASPGEFTRRALEAGRLDLTRVEALADLIDAETEAQRRQAIRQMEGALADAAARWRGLLREARALIEASVDFSDEEVPDDLAERGRERLAALAEELRGALRNSSAERVREGFEVAVVGSPNVGKSSLVNVIAGREVALTSAVAGTTRDVIEVRCDLGGLPVTFLDMAGLREATDPVEKSGVERARKRAAAADLRLFLCDEGEPAGLEAFRDGDIVVRTKADLRPVEGLGVSAVTGAGVDALLAAVTETLAARTAEAGILTRERHRAALEGAVAALAGVESAPVEIAAEAARIAGRRLDSLIGVIDVEDVLDDIFAAFCLGK